MSDAVLYTPEALARIKRGATPDDLGWDMATYLKRCRRHDLTPVLHGFPKLPAPAPQPPTPAPEKPVVFGDIAWFCVARELERGTHRIALTERQGVVFGTLLEDIRRGSCRFISVPELMRGTVSLSARVLISRGVHTLNPALAPMGLVIQVRKGITGGYRLRDLRASP